MITAYVLFVNKNTEWLYTGTAWTLAAADDVLATYKARGYAGKYDARGRFLRPSLLDSADIFDEPGSR